MCSRERERLGWDVRALRGVSCRPLALNLFSKPARAACVAVDPVKKEARQVHRTCVRLSCRTTFCDGSMKSGGRLLYFLLLGLFWAEEDEALIGVAEVAI